MNLADDFRNLGISEGDVLLVHASFKSIGPVDGGADAVIEALTSVLGPSGTLLMPALTYVHVTAEAPIFDHANTPTCVGWLSECFRQSHAEIRSLHPTHSVCALGLLAHELCAQHDKDTTPCGPHSPFALLPKYNGKICFLGCGLEFNTSLHAVEEVAASPYLLGKQPVHYELICSDGSRRKVIHQRHASANGQQFQRASNFLTDLRRANIGEAESTLMNTNTLWTQALTVLSGDPLYFTKAE